MPDEAQCDAIIAIRPELRHLGEVGPMTSWPVRQKSLKGQPPAREFFRRCHRCAADFTHVAPGKTGERGLWNSQRGMRWWCSVECYNHDHPSEPYTE